MKNLIRLKELHLLNVKPKVSDVILHIHDKKIPAT